MRRPFLIGNIVYLRPLERSDAAPITGWINDPEVTGTLQTYRPMTLEAEEEFIATNTRSEHAVVLGIVVKASDQLIGVTGLEGIDFKNGHAQFGLFIGEKGEWGKGYASETTELMVAHAFDTLNLNRVWLHVYENNDRAIRAYEKVGFQREGVLRQETYRQGRYWDTVVMAILRQEWRARQH